VTTAGLYIHVPFCRKKCLYCDFTSYPCAGTDLPRLVGLILKEISLAPAEVPVIDTVFIGGGTPSLLSPPLVGKLLSAVAGKFRMSPDPEISMEMNPESVTAARLRGWRKAGVNRASMGVQCLDDRILRYLGRLADRRRILKAAGAVSAAGFGSVSFDLMFGLPFQDEKILLADIAALLPFGPKHFSLYSLHVPRGSGLAGKLRKDGITLEEDAGLYDAARGALKTAGFAQYEISNFCVPGFECRHNLHYWNYEPYVGVGPAAVGFVGAERWRNTADPAAYGKRLAAGKLPRESREIISPPVARNEYVMMNLRKTSGLDLAGYRGKFGMDFTAEHAKAIRELDAGGLFRCSNGRCFVTEKGMFVSNAIIREFFRD